MTGRKKMRDTRAILLGGLVAGLIGALGALTPAPAAAQCLDCTNTGHPNGGDGHYAVDETHPFERHQWRGGPHARAIWPGDCDDKHPQTCSSGGGGGGGPLYDSGVLDTIAAAVSTGEILEAYRIVLRQPEGSPFRFVPERTAIQVRGCVEGSVTVHIPLGDIATPEFLAAVAASGRSYVAP